MGSNRFDLAVVGAGIVGLGHAAAAIERGLSVVVVERAAGIMGATVRNFGHVSVGSHAGQAGEFAVRSRELWLRLAERSGMWVSQAGALFVARHEDERAVLAESGRHSLLTVAEVERLAPVMGAVGGALLPHDIQVDPRRAAPAIATYLADAGVQFWWSTSGWGYEGGVLHTSRGEIHAEATVFAVGHDVDQVFPEIAEAQGIQRCALDMMLTDGVGLTLPVLTGSSMLRYSAFADAPSAEQVRARYRESEPGLLAHDVNQMYTERPDGTLLVGDTHVTASMASPFLEEEPFALLERLGADLFGKPLHARQRWQGVYAKGPGEFVVESPGEGTRVVSVTTGIGMTCGLGLAESVIDELWGSAPRT